MIPCKLSVKTESFPLIEPFVIARGTRTEAVVLTVTLISASNGATGQGECTPYPRYGESVESVTAQIESVKSRVEAGLSRDELRDIMPAGAARNAIDNALWDLEAKFSGVPAHITAGVDPWTSVTTAFTISIGSPDAMAAAAKRAADRPLLKVKLGGADNLDIDRINAVRRGAPKAALIADANEAWTTDNIAAHLAACAESGYAMAEQPLPAKDDVFLSQIERKIPVCADESVHDRTTLPRLQGLYELINIKLDKTGGLTEAIAVADESERLGFGIMVGCMLGSSLGMAPAMILANRARFVDLDGPLLLAADRVPPLHFEGNTIFPPEPKLWG
jgi:L-alanine-DL-glutamate epimerase and related enzymes of enolase superfamily